MKARIVIIISIVVLFSCTKTKEVGNRVNSFSISDVIISDSISIDNYVIIKADQTCDRLDSSYNIFAGAAAIDSVTSKVRKATSIKINDSLLDEGPDSAWTRRYVGPRAAEGRNLYGRNAKVFIAGYNAADTATRDIYMPKKVLKSTTLMPSGTMSGSSNQTIKWTTDGATEWNNVIVRVEYSYALTKALRSNAPTSITPLTYTTADNGSFTIPSTDLSTFGTNTYVRVSVGRGSLDTVFLPITHAKIFIYAISSITTTPVLIQ